MGSEEVLDLSGSVYRQIQETMGGNGARNRYSLNGNTLKLSEVTSQRYEDDWRTQGTWRQPLWGGKLRLNALVKDVSSFNKALETQSFPTSSQTRGRDRDMEFNSEFGSQYQHGLWEGGEAELVGIRRAGLLHYAQNLTVPSGTTKIGDTQFSVRTKR